MGRVLGCFLICILDIIQEPGISIEQLAGYLTLLLHPLSINWSILTQCLLFFLTSFFFFLEGIRCHAIATYEV